MATVVLTAVGSALGGPVGAAIGAVIGQSIDAQLFAPKPRQGSRLGDLAVQTSNYGTPLPKLFGTMRVAGTVIWAIDLKESRSSSGGGKGRPKMVSYSYSASFAVALSTRPIRAVKRIWADGKLLRGTAGDLKTETKFRLYRGDEEQAADPLILSVEGSGAAPAYRGLAYALFEDFQLADYGNRIPSLSFEVEADEEPVSVGSIAAKLSDGLLAAGSSPDLVGYAASGDSVRGAIEGLAGFVPLSLVEQQGRLLVTVPDGAPRLLAAADAGAYPGSTPQNRDEQVRRAASAVPSSVTLVYSDPARDFQTGSQRAFRQGAALVAEQRTLAAALPAAGAKALAEGRLAALWAGRASATLNLTCRSATLRPGGLVRIEGRAGLWKIERWTLEGMAVRLQLIGAPGGAAAEPPATPGRPVSEADLRHGPTSLRLIEVPAMGEPSTDRPQLFVAAAGSQPGWRRAALTVSFDGGASWQELGQTAAPAVIGVVETAPAPAGAALADRKNAFTVALLNDAMWLENRGEAALANGANLALIGDELLQFGRVEPLGSGRFRVSNLLRGRFGTEWAVTGHQSGEAFVLLDRAALLPIDVAAGALGGEIRVLASGLEDGPDGVTAIRAVSGEALRPPGPVHLQAERDGDDVRLGWVRRSRGGWAWLDGSDAPLGEESERYEVTVAGQNFRRQAIVTEPAFNYSAADRAADGAAGPADLQVVQIGTKQRSRPATLSLIL